ncbi:MAG: tetratricopeptide repeat protein [Fimbriimonadaceae bacterium]|nr:tetratricopeptide repeat protein [Fimbriimonadaceae bacterium]
MRAGAFAPETSLKKAVEHHQAGRLDAAQSAYEAVLRSWPDEPNALMGLGIIAVQLGKFAVGLPYLERVTELEPTNADAWVNLTNALRIAERFEDGVATGQQAVLRANENSNAWSNWAACLRAVGRIGDAVTAAERATELDRNNAEAWRNLGASRLDLGESDAALSAFYNALHLQPEHPECWSNVLFTAQYVDSLSPEVLAGLGAAWGRAQPESIAIEKSEKVQRIGFVSGDFRGHPVGRFVGAILPELALRGVQVALIKNQPADDEITKLLESHAFAVIDVWGKSTDEAFDSVSALCLDVAIDLSGHSSHHRLDLFAERVAPRQYTWLGYSAPTGIPAIDGWIVGSNMVPTRSAENAGLEPTLTLDGLFLADLAGNAVASPAPSASGAPITFGSFNNPAKIGPRTRALWASVLHSVPESRLRMKYRVFDDEETRAHWTKVWGEFGIEPARILFQGWTDSAGRESDYGKVDIALDPYPYSGATTTLDLLKAGIPVVTLCGDRYASRMSASFLDAIGHSEWVAESETDFVRIAESLVRDPDALTEIRRQLIPDVESSHIFDASGFVDAFLHALEVAP